MRYAALAALLAAACYTPQNPSLCDGEACSGGGSDAAVAGDRYLAVSVGARSVCAIGAGDHGLYCWGDNSLGQVGIGSIGGVVEAPTLIDSGTEYAAVAVGGDHACARTTDGGMVKCWGDNRFGQSDPFNIGVSPTMPTVTDVGLVGDVVLAAGPTLSCASGGTQTQCWGQLVKTDPVMSSSAHVFTAISIGTDHACGIEHPGAAECWGSNQEGQLGSGSAGPVDIADAVPTDGIGPTGLSRISAGHGETCAIGDGGDLKCWGVDERSDGQVVEDRGTGWSEVVVGERTVTLVAETCGILDGEARCWGTSRFGGLGDGHWREDMIAPASAVPIGAATEVHLGLDAAGGFQAGAVTTFDEGGCLLDGDQIRCWGANAHGELGHAASQHGPREVVAPPLESWVSVSAGDQHTCAASATGKVFCWGANDLGQVDLQPHPICDASCDKAVPTLVTVGLANIQQVIGGADFACGRGLGGIECWGDNSHGGLGVSTAGITSGSPDVDAGGPLFGGPLGMCGTKGAGIDVCWGRIDGTTHTMADQRGLTSGAEPAATAQFLDKTTCALTPSGKRFCSGDNMKGEFGNGTTTSQSGATDVTGGLTYTALAGRFQHLCGVTLSMGVVCWGSNEAGESGSDTQNPVLSVHAMGLGTCDRVATGTAHSCAACKATVACWGRGGLGELGRADGNDLSASVPQLVDVPPNEMYDEVTAGLDHTCAMTATHRIFCWGFGPRGELGDGSHGSAVPVQLGARSM